MMSLMNNVAEGMNYNLLDPKAQMGERLPEAQGCVMMACHRPGGGDQPSGEASRESPHRLCGSFLSLNILPSKPPVR